MVGGLIMAHGDDNGLRVPPRLAPTQVAVLLVRAVDGAGEKGAAITADLRAAGVRVTYDDRTDTSFGRRATDWELKGVPLRVEVGPRDLANGEATLVHRFTGTKEQVGVDALRDRTLAALDEAQAALLAVATARRDASTVDVTDIDAAREAGKVGFCRIPWATLGVEGETKLAEAAVSVRCLLAEDGGVPRSEDDPGVVAVCGRSY
jgi:prolyl-tRNA synthetase